MTDFSENYDLSEEDIRMRYITPAIQRAGWNTNQIRGEYSITAGRIVVRGQTCQREAPRKADYVLFYKPNKPIAVIEAKDYNHNLGDGMQQALDYAKMLDVPFVFSSNGSGFLFHNKYIEQGDVEIELALGEFPSPETLWDMYCQKNHINPSQQRVIDEAYYSDNPNKQPRYYQINAINKTVEAIAAGQNRILLVMATGTGKTYTAFQIIWRLWKSGLKKRILFLADRTALVAQAFHSFSSAFKDKILWLDRQSFDTAHEIYLALYQGVVGDKDTDSLFEQFSPDFFDLIIVDECHRGITKTESTWKTILEYFSSATQIGLTATPKETKDESNIEYFGDPIYTYSLKEGIDDGYLAPYRVIRVFFDRDIEGFVPYNGQMDDRGVLIEEREYNIKDIDKVLILPKRTELIAKTVSNYFRKYNCRMDKTIFFCVDQDHAARMRQALINENSDMVAQNDKYVMRITADDVAGKDEISNFSDQECQYPVLVTTSDLLSTGVDIRTLKYIVLDANIESMTKFKQIIGRGTRICEDYDKQYFTIFDFRNATKLFHDPKFDGPIEQDENFDPNNTTPPPVPKKPTQERLKYYVNGESVNIVQTSVQNLDHNGHLTTENFIDYTRKSVQGQYASLEDFLSAWNSEPRKQDIINELEKHGIPFDVLCDEVGKDSDPFDLILHIVYDKPLLTRKERAENVRKRNYFTKYGPQAAEILDALLTKYADSGIKDLENENILKVSPFDKFGTPIQIIMSRFGDINTYQSALQELKKMLYS